MKFFEVVLVLLSLVMALSLYRVFKGPSLFDRLTGIALISTKTVVLLLVLGVLHDHLEYYVDIALTYAILGFVGPLVIAKYLEMGVRKEENDS